MELLPLSLMSPSSSMPSKSMSAMSASVTPRTRLDRLLLVASLLLVLDMDKVGLAAFVEETSSVLITTPSRM